MVLCLLHYHNNFCEPCAKCCLLKHSCHPFCYLNRDKNKSESPCAAAANNQLKLFVLVTQEDVQSYMQPERARQAYVITWTIKLQRAHTRPEAFTRSKFAKKIKKTLDSAINVNIN